MSKHQLAKFGWLSIVILAVAVLTGCAGRRTRPRVWIDAPLDGSQHELGTIEVVSHSACDSGTREIALLVNGQEYRRDASPDSSARIVTVVQPWDPPAEGQYTLQVIAYTRGRRAGDPATVQVTIGTAAGTPPPTVVPEMSTRPPAEPTWIFVTPTSAPAGPTATPMAATPTPTSGPMVTLTSTPADTPIPLAEVSFWVERDSITAGECTVLHWEVENATAVFVNGEGVGGHGTMQVCPTSTATYDLHVEAPGGDVDRRVTVTVTIAEPSATPTSVPASPTPTSVPASPTPTSVPPSPTPTAEPADTTGPEITDIQESADPIYTTYPSGCSPTEVTIRARITDPSGVDRARVRYRIGGGEWNNQPMTAIGGDLYQATLPTPGVPTTIEYFLQARDTLGNRSGSEHGTVEVIQCSP